MKRLRLLSIRDPDALDRRNYRSAWGIGYWLRVNRRKHLERQARQLARMILPLVRVDVDPALPGEEKLDATPAPPVVH